MSRPERYQPSWDRLNDGELDYTGAVPQRELLEATIRRALVEADQAGRLPTWGARAMARHLADHLDPEPSAMHRLAITGGGVISDLLNEAAGIALSPDCPDHLKACANAIGGYIHQEIRLRGLVLPPDETTEEADS
ncbi:MAG: hypothetical protein QM655_14810 [Nocardioidaceae bacterium]